MKTTIILLILAVACLAQAPADFSKPTLVFVGAGYNQFAGANGVVSAIIPYGTGKMYASGTIDLVPNKFTDPVSGRTGYVVGPSVRFGVHRQFLGFPDGKTVLLLGADVGPSFSQDAISIGGTNVGLSGSFTMTLARMVTDHIGFAIPVRALYMSGAGPGGTAAWNPKFEFGILFKP